MKKWRLIALPLLAAAVIAGCEYDDSQLRSDVRDLQERMDRLETWCTEVNRQIGYLQGLVTALEEQDYVTGVTPLVENGREIGYTITFTRSAPITILHGRDGAKGDKGDTGDKGDKGDTGAAGLTPVIGVRQHTDGHYYWTVKIGDAAATWMLDSSGNMIRTTGDKGETGDPGEPGATGPAPVVSVADFEGVLYWQIDGEWLLQNGQKVPATGEPGDSVFAENGVDTSDPDNVTFTLADGVTRITLPRASTVTVGFDSYETFYGSQAADRIALVLPATLKADDYIAIAASVTGDNGMGSDVVTRAAGDTWRVKVTPPTFADGKPVAGSACVTLTPPADTRLSETALLRVSITDTKGREYAVTRPVKWFDGTIVESTAGGLSTAVTDPTVTGLAVTGGMDASDFAFIRQNMTALEVLDLSMTDLAVIPDRCLAFNDSPNTTLRRVVLPDDVAVIEDAAFANCRALESVDTRGARQLGQWAFENCYALTEVRLGDGLEEIAKCAFLNCISLEEIDIPASVRTLGRWVFEGCEALERVTLHEGLQNLSESTFWGAGIVSIRIPTTVTEIPAYAFQNCKRLERITLHDGIVSIGEGAFNACQSLRQFRVPKGVTVLSNNLFEACTNLQFVEFHDGITEMQERAFAKCESLRGPADGTYLMLPTSLRTAGDGVFEFCTVLKLVNMSETQVTAIASNMFARCSSLVQVMLPEVLEQIGPNAFAQCKAMSSVYLPATIRSIGDLAFWDCEKLGMVVCKTATPPTIAAGTFDKNYKAGRLLFVPRGADYSDWANYFERITANQ